MGKRDDLIEQYASDLKNKCGMDPDMDLLTKVTIGCGPAIYDADASTVASSQESELETVKNNFLIKKLGLADGPELMEAINSVVETYGKSERNKYRAVVYYMLTKHFEKIRLRLSRRREQIQTRWFLRRVFSWVHDDQPNLHLSLILQVLALRNHYGPA